MPPPRSAASTRTLSRAVPAIAMLLPACGDAAPIACTEEARPGIMIEVVSATGSAPIVEGISGDISDGAFESGLAALPGDNLLFGATERPGTYTARVRATGYREATLTSIVVRADECHVITEERTATLTPGDEGVQISGRRLASLEMTDSRVPSS